MSEDMFQSPNRAYEPSDAPSLFRFRRRCIFVSIPKPGLRAFRPSRAFPLRPIVDQFQSPNRAYEPSDTCPINRAGGFFHGFQSPNRAYEPSDKHAYAPFVRACSQFQSPNRAYEPSDHHPSAEGVAGVPFQSPNRAYEPSDSVALL